MTDCPSALPGSPPSRQWSALFVFGAKVRPAELQDLPRAEVRRERLDDRAAAERELQRRPERCHLVRRRLDHLLLAPGPVEVGLGRRRAGSRESSSRRARVGRPCAGGPSRSASPSHVSAARGRCVGAVEAIGEDRRGDVDVDAADRVDQLPEAVEVDEGDMVHVEPGQALHRPQRECRAAVLEGGVDLGGAPCPGCRPSGRAGSRGRPADACADRCGSA